MLLKIMQESKLIHMILCLQEKALTLHNVIILLKSAFQRIKITSTIINSKKDVQINNINILYYDRTDAFEGKCMK